MTGLEGEPLRPPCHRAGLGGRRGHFPEPPAPPRLRPSWQMSRAWAVAVAFFTAKRSVDLHGPHPAWRCRAGGRGPRAGGPARRPRPALHGGPGPGSTSPFLGSGPWPESWLSQGNPVRARRPRPFCTRERGVGGGSSHGPGWTAAELGLSHRLLQSQRAPTPLSRGQSVPGPEALPSEWALSPRRGLLPHRESGGRHRPHPPGTASPGVLP